MKSHLLLGVLLLCGCTAKAPVELESIDLRELLASNAERIPLTEIVSSQELVPLENHDSALIGNIRDIVAMNKQIFISSNNICTEFDKQGNFVRNIGKKGQGPEEYAYLSGLETQGDHLILQDGDRKYMHYNPSGTFIKEQKLPKGYQSVYPLSDGGVVGFAPNVSGEEPLKLALFDSEGTLTDSVPHRLRFTPKFAINLFDEGQFYRYNDKVMFKDLLNDTIYQIQKGKVKPYMRLELGERGAKENARAEMTETPQTFRFFKDMERTHILGESDRYVFVEMGGYICYDKQAKTAKRIDLMYNDQELKGLFFSEDNKYLITSLQPDNEDNPQLLFLKLKD